MRVWVVSFFILFTIFFGMAELFPWLAAWSMTTPAWVIAGMLLAIASNADRPAGWPWHPRQPTAIPPPEAPIATVPPPIPSAAPADPPPPPPPRRLTPSPRSISFTIKKPDPTSRQQS